MLKQNYLYVCNIKDLENEELYSSALSCLSKQRKEKVDAYKSLNDKKLCIVAELLLRKLFKDLSINSDFVYAYKQNNKPYLIDHKELDFNISHSGEYVICALSNDDIGCDIEKIKDVNLDISKKYFSNNEYTNIINSDNKEDTFYRYWVLKESFMKATGLGFKLRLNEFEVTISNKINIKQTVDNKSYNFNEVLINGYKCAVCSTNNNDLIIKTINLKGELL